MQVIPVSWTTVEAQGMLVPASVEARPEAPAGGPADIGLDVLARASRLIVLVPDAGVDPNELAEEVRRLDPDRRLEVVYLALTPSADVDEPWVRRELVTLGSLTRDGRPSVELRTEATKDWIRAVGPIYRPGDALVCLRGRNLRANLGRRPRLAETLARAFDATVVEVEGLTLGGRPSSYGLVRSLLGTVPFLVVAGFLAIQIPLERSLMAPGWERQGLQVLLLGVELSLIWLWETRVM